MRILLISPPFYRLTGFHSRYFPFGLTMLASVLRESGHQVNIYDADLSARCSSFDYSRLPERYPEYLRSLQEQNHPVWRDVKRTIIDFQPDMIGISVYTVFAASALRVAEIARQALPRCTIVAGGPHATVRAEEILNISPDFDFVIRGEGEEALLCLANYLEGTRRDIASIPGLSRRENTIVHHTRSQRIHDIDALPCPDRSVMMQEKRYTSEDMGLIMTSRGCPFRCTFCASETQRISYRSIEHVIEEIRSVKERYGTRQFTIKDDSFTVNAQRVIDFCSALRRSKMNIRWECNTRVGLLNKPLLRIMKEAGCNFIKIGIESGSDRVLRTMNKGITTAQIRETARMLRKAAIHWTGYFMMGVPAEAEDDVHQTLDLMREIRPDAALLAVYEPFPGTAMFDEGVARGLFKPSMTRDEYFSTLPNHYYKREPRSRTAAIEPGRFLELEHAMKRTFHAHNTRPRNLLAIAGAKLSVYLGHPASMAADLIRYVHYRRGS